MCGIVGFTGAQQAAPILLDGLSKLEYRGYDSAGISVRNEETGEIEVVKAKGRLKTLIEKAPAPHGMPLLAEPAFKLPTNDAERDDRTEYNRKISRQYVAKMLEIAERF